GTYNESVIYQRGEHITVVDTPVGRLGMTICYDLRFPGLFQALREQGAEIISVPAAFTRYTGQAHWEPLLRARAIENQCYIL
ncbi:carbon-nitrogen hydrolase family protein, partial [Escherichia coli]|nr:carbon-nitrogen hydrolase family protein [Escherichia coli]